MSNMLSFIEHFVDILTDWLYLSVKEYLALEKIN